MKSFAANDLEAADLLALARLDDDGAPPARDGQDRHAVRRAGDRPPGGDDRSSAPGPARVPAGPVR
jgi:hypothetical protein